MSNIQSISIRACGSGRISIARANQLAFNNMAKPQVPPVSPAPTTPPARG
jgi:hypothetical protein